MECQQQSVLRSQIISQIRSFLCLLYIELLKSHEEVDSEVSESEESDADADADADDDADAIRPRGSCKARRTIKTFMDLSEKSFESTFRMPKYTFQQLVAWLEDNEDLTPTTHFPSELQVMIFVWILGHDASQRKTALMFHISQTSVCRVFAKLLPMFVTLHNHTVRLPEKDYLSPFVELSHPWRGFNGCIGAVDTAHIPIIACKKGGPGQSGPERTAPRNVVVAVGFDQQFQYVLAGSDGFMDAATFQREAGADGFTMPPHRYYLADRKFASLPGFVVPFSNRTDHLPDLAMNAKRPENIRDLYDWRHLQLRNSVDKAVSSVKKMFEILQNSSDYSLDDQTGIFYAVTGLYNFIQQSQVERQRLNDKGFTAEESSRRHRQLAVARERANRVVVDDLNVTRRLVVETLWTHNHR